MSGFEQHSEVELIALANTVARRVARKWPGSESEELASEGLLDLYTKVDKLADKDTRYLYRVLERSMMLFASKARYDKMVATSQYVYTPAEVRILLEHAYFKPDKWDVPTKKDDSTADWVEAGTVGVSLIDMKTAMDRINPTDRGALEERYFHQGGQAGDNTEQKRVQRAVDNLTRFMNYALETREVDGPERREVISNYKAQDLTRYQNEADSSPDEDALDKVQKEYVNMGLRPGQGFDWDKHKKG